MTNKHYIIQDDTYWDGDFEMECYNHPEFNGSSSTIEDIERQLYRLEAGTELDDPDFPDETYIEMWLTANNITYEIVGTREWLTDYEKLVKLKSELKFPVHLRKMWTGQEVQDWIDKILEDI